MWMCAYVIVHWNMRRMQISPSLCPIFQFSLSAAIICGQRPYILYWMREKARLCPGLKSRQKKKKKNPVKRGTRRRTRVGGYTYMDVLHMYMHACGCAGNVLAPRVCVTFILWPLMMRALRESQERLNKEIRAHPRNQERDDNALWLPMPRPLNFLSFAIPLPISTELVGLIEIYRHACYIDVGLGSPALEIREGGWMCLWEFGWLLGQGVKNA